MRKQQIMENNWLMKQSWRNVCFIHYQVEPELLKNYVPPCFNLDLYGGYAWITVVPFQFLSFQIRGFPNLSLPRPLNEINVRTYVSYKGMKGVYFFHLDVQSRLIAWGAGSIIPLPFHYARIMMVKDGNYLMITSRRNEKRLFISKILLKGETFRAKSHSIDYWLTERYVFFTVNSRGEVLEGRIIHPSWLLETALCDVECNTLLPSIPALLKKPHITHFSQSMNDVKVFPLQNLS
jgi:uncharacterized protein